MPNLRFYGGGDDIHYAKETEVLICGPRGTGKSIAVLHKVYLMLSMFPNARALILRKTRKSLTSSTIPTFENTILDPGPLKDFLLKSGGSHGYRQRYVFPHGASLELGSMQDVDSFKSADYDMIVIEEAESIQNEADYLTLIPCLRNSRMVLNKDAQGCGVPPRHFHQIICCCNPGSPNHWLNRRANTDAMRRIRSHIRDNPRHWDYEKDAYTDVGEQYYSTFNHFPPYMKKRYLDGEWVAAEGIVYPDFDESIHVIPKVPEGVKIQRTIAAVDWGHAHPTSILVIGKGSDDKFYVLDEYYGAGKTVDELAKVCRDFQNRYQVEVFVCDAANKGNIDFFNKSGIPSTTTDKRVEFGISLVTQRLSQSKIHFLDKIKPRDTGLSGAQGLLDEFSLYCYKTNKNGQQTDTVEKTNDDALDALRYGIVYLDSADNEMIWSIF